jgi:hypothetical protein
VDVRASRASLALAALLALVGMALSVPGQAGAATVQEPDTPILLRGEGTDYAQFVLRSLDGAVATSEAAPGVDYIASNESEGLRAFLEERVEFYVGSLPLDEVDPAATAKLKDGRGVVSAPFQATAAVPFMSGPFGRGFRWCASGVSFNEETFELTCADPGGAVPLRSVRSGKSGDSLRLYPKSMVTLFTQSTPTDFWFDPEFASQADPTGCPPDPAGGCLQRIDLPGTPGPTSGVRTDGASVNKYLQEYVRFLDRAAFDSRVLAEVADPAAHKITVRWPRSSQPSRSPDDNLVSTVAGWASFQTAEIPKGGAVALVHPKRARDAYDLEQKDAEKVPPQTVTDLWITDYVHHGETVSATPDAITAAVAAGGEAPFHAAYETVPGAWPFTWVNRIHFPERGLSVDQTNAAALVLRLQMTAGQVKAAELADGRLSPPLVAEALAAANEVVDSNCIAAKGKVVKQTGAGPFTPEGLGPVLESLGSVSWCQATEDTPPPSPPAQPSPSDAAGTGGAAPFDLVGLSDLPLYDGSAGFSDGAGAYLDAGSVAGASASGVPTGDSPGVDAEGEGAEEDADVETIAAEMPLSLPGTDPRAMDRLATLALGGALFFLCRALWRSRMLHRVAGVAP